MTKIKPTKSQLKLLLAVIRQKQQEGLPPEETLDIVRSIVEPSDEAIYKSESLEKAARPSQ